MNSEKIRLDGSEQGAGEKKKHVQADFYHDLSQGGWLSHHKTEIFPQNGDMHLMVDRIKHHP